MLSFQIPLHRDIREKGIHGTHTNFLPIFQVSPRSAFPTDLRSIAIVLRALASRICSAIFQQLPNGRTNNSEVRCTLSSHLHLISLSLLVVDAWPLENASVLHKAKATIGLLNPFFHEALPTLISLIIADLSNYRHY